MLIQARQSFSSRQNLLTNRGSFHTPWSKTRVQVKHWIYPSYLKNKIII